MNEQKQPAVAGPVEPTVRPPKLSPACQELLDAMKRGVKVHGIFGFHSYYFREDNHRKCTRQIDTLRRLGLVKETRKDWRGCIVVPAA